MTGKKGDHRKDEPFRVLAAEQPFQVQGTADAHAAQTRAQRHRITPRIHKVGGEDIAGFAIQSEEQPVEHRCRRMGRIQILVEDFLPDGGPSQLPGQDHFQPVFGKQSQLPGHGERRTIGEGDETDPDWSLGPDRGTGEAGRGNSGGHEQNFKQTLCHLLFMNSPPPAMPP